MKNYIKKILVCLLVIIVVSIQVVPVIATDESVSPTPTISEPTPTIEPAITVTPTPIESEPSPTDTPKIEEITPTVTETPDPQTNTTENTTTSQETNQNNDASVDNSLDQASITGSNDASKNMGDSSIQTGDANTSGTLVTAVNTNASGVTVSEFNIVDDQTGDLVLDFDQNCISGCQIASSDESSSVVQANTATASGELVLKSDSGENTASYNTGGDSQISTGDANVTANSLTLANNNLEGNITFGVVNIYGNLVGDIVLPDEVLLPVVGQVSSSNTNNATQSNEALIENNLLISAQTGDNQADKNTGGDTTVQTGNSEVLAQTLNIANSNVEGGSWWLVIVNKAGEWVGQILGAPEGSNMAGSAGTEFTVGQNGEVQATNTNANISSTKTSDVTQTNSAQITNNLNLTANTGGNTASYNTGGDSSIKTGDAKIIANIINFVNNNISGNGKLIVTTVNIFGSWIGNFVTPGNKKPPKQENPPVGNIENTTSVSVSQNNQPSSSTSSNNDSGGSQSIDTSIGVSAQVSQSIKTTVKNQQQQVQGIFNQVISLTDGQGQYKLAINEATNDQKTPEKITVNLAWGLIPVPFVLILILFKKLLSIFK